MLPSSRPEGAPPTYHTGWLPIIGTFLEFAKNPVALAAKGYAAKGNCFTINVFGQNLTFMLGPVAHERFFSTDDRYLSQSEVYKFMTPVFGKGIVYDAPPKMMSEQLAFISSALKGKALHSYVPKIAAETEAYFDKHWKDGDVVSLHESMSELTILTASTCLMGPEVRETLFEKVASIFHRLDDGITPLSFFWPNAPTPEHWDRDRARVEMGAIFQTLVRKRRSDPEASTKYSDVVQVFVDSKYRDGSSTTEDQVCGLMVALLFAGQHTSSITSTWLTLMLASHETVRERVLAESERLWNRDDSAVEPASAASAPGGLGFAKIDDMGELFRCFKETLRLYPPLVFLMRKVTKQPLVVGSHKIPVGDIVVASPQVSHRLPEGPDQVFTRPDAFDPDRFADGRKEDEIVPEGFKDAKKKPKAFVGFGGGYHTCRGSKFATVQVQAILSVLLRDWHIELVDPVPEPNFSAIVVGPQGKTRVRVTRRKRTA
jgi:sterol 14-demethylase